MNLLQFRFENNKYLDYFTNERTNFFVNEIGKNILDGLINKNRSINEILHHYQDVDIKDAYEFLDHVENGLKQNSLNEPEQIQLSSPIEVELELTTACNLRCKH